ncbi:hypothetical protein [Gorillibacterium massiliense]|uniref:hypothetical protein n=1 Tax=Gorillibacterium massiliense TaxID=1280390 RepID=UPI0004B59EA5|nr:hypothetical protein [Gorillibacterium massiliense]
MKKSEWLIALLLIGMGIGCMIVSAAFYRSDMVLVAGRIFKKACMIMMAAGVLGGVLYYWLRNRKGRS